MVTQKIRWYIIILGLVAIGLRLPLLGDQPYTDEGVYAAASYFNHLAYTGTLGAEGWILPKEGHIGLYPLLSSWVYFLPWEPFLLLRLLDSIVAAAAGVAVYRFLVTALDERPIAMVGALLFVVEVNHPVFINAGYKNSILVAVMLTAMALESIQKGGNKRCFQAGAFMAGAILFREFFFSMSIFVALYSMVRCGWPGFVRFVMAGLAVAIGVITIIVLLRGNDGLGSLINAYFEFDSVVKSRTSFESAFKQAVIAADIFLPMLPLACIGLIAPAISKRYRKNLDIYVLGILLALCPTLEIWYKSPFPYHFSQSTLGLVILFCLGLRVVVDHVRLLSISHRSAAIILGLFGLAANFFLFLDYAKQYYWQVDSAVRFAPVMIRGDWTSAATEKSFYLRAARAIRENTSPSETMMTESNSVGLFPLTFRLPSVTGMGSLGRVLMRHDSSMSATEMAQLIKTPPDVLVLMPRTHLGENLNVFSTELINHYSQIINQGRGLKPYGGWSTEIYLLKDFDGLPKNN